MNRTFYPNICNIEDLGENNRFDASDCLSWGKKLTRRQRVSFENRR